VGFCFCYVIHFSGSFVALKDSWGIQPVRRTAQRGKAACRMEWIYKGLAASKGSASGAGVVAPR